MNNKTIKAVPEDVKRLFNRFAYELIAAGWRHYSADAILHRIRWHYHVTKGNREFKCNDHWTAYLARWWLQNNPQYSDFFALRTLAPYRRPRPPAPSHAPSP